MKRKEMGCLTQRIELNYIIPAIRKKLIENLEREGLKDSEIAQRLDVTKAAISQYKHKKRGKEIRFPKEIEKVIEKAARAIKKNKNPTHEIIKIINQIKSSRYICVICKECKK
ncbi:MAG: hypothetical protein K6T16_02505 [Candidatus Pacearchaeota archaeon]|nr:hypothetical protein [Candidatus Pacearchaeota archaeon]